MLRFLFLDNLGVCDEPTFDKPSLSLSSAVFTDRLMYSNRTLQEKVKKVLDIWSRTSTFSSEALKSAYGKLNGENDAAGSKTTKTLDTAR